MAQSQRLSESDARVVFRLLGDLREMRQDRSALDAHMVESLRQVVNATGGFVTSIDGWRPNGNLRMNSLTPTRNGIDVVASALRIAASNNDLLDDPTFYYGIHHTERIKAIPFHRLTSDADIRRNFPLMCEVKLETQHVDHLIGWRHRGSTPGNIFGISLHRYGRREKHFSARETAIIQLFFEELDWLERTGRLDSSATQLDELPPRLRQILHRMLQGHAPKQIAEDLGLSIHTVRDHIKRLYHSVGVSGRDELMARFVQRTARGNER